MTFTFKHTRILAAAYLFSALSLTTGCHQMTQVGESQKTVLGGDEDVITPPSQKTDYSLISPSTIESTLTGTLGVPANDPSVQKVRNNAQALGAGDPGAGIPADATYSALKSKLIMEIYIDGCVIGLQNQQVRNRLFPNGLQDYDAFYLTVMGRKPSLDEKTVLDDIQSRVSETIAPAAVCGAILSSIESTNRS